MKNPPMATLPASADRPSADSAALADLRGVSRLLIDAVMGVTDIVEDMHGTIAGVAPIVGSHPRGRTRGITGLVYGSVRGITRAVGYGLDAALSRLAPLLLEVRAAPGQEAILAALNGVFGDYLVASQSPLAIPMQLRRNGLPIAIEKSALAANPEVSRKLVVLIHGLCMNDLQWHRDGHDHGAALAADLGYVPLYLHYNSGRHVSENGRALAALIEQLHQQWPVAIEELVIIGHSMGGLVARSACHYAIEGGHAWLRSLGKLIFLGTPHHGAPLERAGNRVDMLLGVSPYTAPFARLGAMRSAGVKDLRHGYVVDEDWQSADSVRSDDARTHAPLPDHVQCFAIAASKSRGASKTGASLRGDGLVPVYSALGRHANPQLSLPIPSLHQRVIHDAHHFDLLSRGDVYDCIKNWM